MLVVEHFDLVFVDVAHGGRGDCEFVAVCVVAGFGEGVEVGGGGGGGGGEDVVEDAEGGEVGGGEGGAGVVGEAGVVLGFVLSVLGWEELGKGEKRRG